MADEEAETIFIDGEEYRMPFSDVLEQNVDDDSLIKSIENEGMIYPIVYRETDEGREIIDGNTRAKLVAEGKVDLDDVEFEEVEVEDSSHAYDLAIQLNFQRRQIGPAQRRKTIERIMDDKPWRKASAHVKDFAELLGVSKSTISNDIKKIEGGDEVDELRDEKKRINYLLTGLRYLDNEEVTKPDVSDQFDEDEIEVGEEYMEAVFEGLEARRKEITEKLKEQEED